MKCEQTTLCLSCTILIHNFTNRKTSQFNNFDLKTKGLENMIYIHQNRITKTVQYRTKLYCISPNLKKFSRYIYRYF